MTSKGGRRKAPALRLLAAARFNVKELIRRWHK